MGGVGPAAVWGGGIGTCHSDWGLNCTVDVLWIEGAGTVLDSSARFVTRLIVKPDERVPVPGHRKLPHARDKLRCRHASSLGRDSGTHRLWATFVYSCLEALDPNHPLLSAANALRGRPWVAVRVI